MAGRGSQSFKKRQKEQQRKEKQQEKFAKRLQKKTEPSTGPIIEGAEGEEWIDPDGPGEETPDSPASEVSERNGA
jgi:hypothetical protein